MQEMLTTSYPHQVPLGAEDFSIRTTQTIYPSEPILPTHIPLFYILAPKGNSKKEYLTYGNIIKKYGEEALNSLSKYYNHSSRYLLTALNLGANCVVKRIIPTTAHYSGTALYAKTYEENSIVSIAWGQYNNLGEGQQQTFNDTIASLPNVNIDYQSDGLIQPVLNQLLPTKDGFEPILSICAEAPGEYYNGIGFAIEPVAPNNMNMTLVNEMKSILFKIYLFRQSKNSLTPQIIPTVYGNQYVLVSLKPNAINPATNSKMDITTIINNNYWNEEDGGLPLVYKEVSIYFYSSNYNKIVTQLMNAEKSNTTNAGYQDASIIGAYGMNPFTCTTTEGKPYTNIKKISVTKMMQLINPVVNKQKGVTPAVKTQDNGQPQTITHTDTVNSGPVQTQNPTAGIKPTSETPVSEPGKTVKDNVSSQTDNIKANEPVTHDAPVAPAGQVKSPAQTNEVHASNLMANYGAVNPLAGSQPKKLDLPGFIPVNVEFSVRTPFFLTGGTDGLDDNIESNVQLFESIVINLLGQYAQPNSPVQDINVNPETHFYDSGYSLPTKHYISQFLGGSKSHVVILSTYSPEQQNPDGLSNLISNGTALAKSIELYPESEYFNTPACRGTVVYGSMNIVENGDKVRISQSYDLLVKTCNMMSGTTWNAQLLFDAYPLNVINTGTDCQPAFIPDAVKAQLWKEGGTYSEPFDLRSFFVPGYKTVYNNDTSVLNSYFTVCALANLTVVGNNCWKKFTGVSNLSDAELKSKIQAYCEFLLHGLYDGVVTVVPEVVLTEADVQRGYSWHIIFKLYSGGMKSVCITQTQVYRTESLTK